MSLLDLEVKHLKYDKPLLDALVIPKPIRSEQEVIVSAHNHRPKHIDRSIIVWHWSKFWAATLN